MLYLFTINLFHCFILFIFKAVVAPTSAPAQDDTQTMLIAVAAALFLIIVGFAFAIYHIRRKQGRKLKAASASSKNSGIM